MSTPDTKSPITHTLRIVAIVGGVFTLGSLAFKDVRVTTSVLIGTALALGNLWVLAKIVASLMPAEPEKTANAEGAEATGAEPRRGAGGWGIVAILKIFALFGGAFLLWKSHVALPLPTLLGYGALPIGIFVGSVLRPARG